MKLAHRFRTGQCVNENVRSLPSAASSEGSLLRVRTAYSFPNNDQRGHR